MADVARYYHTSLYAFGEQARSAVISTFNELVQDVAIRCWYDAAQETFVIECSTAVGSVADEALTAILMKYIEKELDDAENEEREPHVLRFPESRFDALDGVPRTHDTAGEDDPTSAAPIISGRSSVTHLVVVGGVEGKLLKFFRLNELKAGLLERTLAPFNKRAQRIVNNGLTCRAVRWNDEVGRHLFNGRAGSDRLVETVVVDEFELPEFQQLHDSRTMDTDSDDLVRTWMHAGEAPTVEQWVRGIGETRQQDPEEKAEMPKDARNLIVADNRHAIGRVRVPKGGQVIDEVSTSEASEDERPSADAFSNLLNGGTGAISGSGDSDSDEAEDSAELVFTDLLEPSGSKQMAKSTRQSVSGDWDMLANAAGASIKTRLSAAPVTFGAQPKASQSLAASRQQYDSFPTPESSLLSRGQTPVTGKQPQSLARERAVTNLSQDTVIRQTKASAKDEHSFPSYGKDFAGVDPQGLHGSPAATARWEIENYNEKKTKWKRQVIALRQRNGSGFWPAPTNNSDCGQRDSQTGTRGYSVASEATLVNPPVQTDADWVNTVVQPRVRLGRLVDDRAHVSDRLPNAPPGFQKAARAKHDEEIEATEPSDGQLVDVAANVLEDLPSQPAARVIGDIHKPLVPTPSAIAHAKHQTHGADHDDPAEYVIVERVQNLPGDYATKRNTMRQKAGKKNKAKNTPKIGGKSTARKVELPLPSPPPPPRPKPTPEPQTKQQKRQGGIQSQNAGKAPRAPVLPPASSITSGTHLFGQVLHDLRQHIASLSKNAGEDTDAGTAQPAMSVKLACQVGIVLLRGLDKAISNPTIEPEVLQYRLNASSASIKRDLFSRITTSTADAKALVGVMSQGGGRVVAAAEYNIVIRDDAGALLTITVPSGDKESYTISSQDQILTEACAHFPTRVWDARYTLIQSGGEADTPASKAIKRFVASIQSVKDAPSFRAMVSVGAFTLVRVMAKKTFSQTTDNITAKVVQVQDLIIDPVDLKHHNVQAIALSEDRMAEEQRLWWEASWETARLDVAEELQSRVSEAICSIDHIGVENRGPGLLLKESDKAERQAVPVGGVLW